jgi:hypothetical protein
LEDLGRKNGVKLDVYCDEVIQFKEAFQYYSGYMTNGTDYHYTLDNGMTAWFDLKQTTYKGMLNSEEEPLIQMADLLCSVMQSLIIYEGNLEKEQDLAVIGTLIANTTMNYNTIHYLMDVNKLSSLIERWTQLSNLQMKKLKVDR